MPQLIPNADQAHKFSCVWAAFGLLLLNIAAVVLPTPRAHITPDQLAYINSGLAVLVMVLRVLRQQGLINNAMVPGLDAIIGPAAVVQGDVNVTINPPVSQPDAAAASAAKPVQQQGVSS